MGGGEEPYLISCDWCKSYPPCSQLASGEAHNPCLVPHLPPHFITVYFCDWTHDHSEANWWPSCDLNSQRNSTSQVSKLTGSVWYHSCRAALRGPLRGRKPSQRRTDRDGETELGQLCLLSQSHAPIHFLFRLI